MTVTTIAAPLPISREFDNSGSPLGGGLVYTYQAGSLTPLATYQTSDTSTPNINPIKLDSTGRAIIRWLPNVAYRVVIKDFTDTTTLWSEDYFYPPITGQLYPITAAETSASLTPTDFTKLPGNVLRYGIVPNSSSAATANTAALTALLLPTVAGPVGTMVFPNTTGVDIYYFNDLIGVRDGIILDLQDCTLNFTKASSTGNESSAGFLTMIRDCQVINGSITVNYTGGASLGACICVGVRGSECGSGAFFPNTYDAALVTPQGNCRLSNLRLTTNNPLGIHIQLTGGLQNVTLDNIWMNGQAVADGIDYEFGWATSGTTNLRQSAHASNLRFINIHFYNGNTTGSSAGALTIAGAYNATVDGLYVDKAGSALTVTPGESLFYRPWSPADLAGAKRNVSIKNVVGSRLYNTGMTLTGAQLGSGGYLAAIIAALGATAQNLAQTDLYYFSVDGFSLDGSGNPANGFGILSSAGRLHLKNGYIFGGFQRGIVLTDECTIFDIYGVGISQCTQQGMQFYGSPIWSPARLKKGRITNCYIAGNSTSSAGGSPGIDMKNVDSLLIYGNHIGYVAAYGGSAETTQGNGVQIDATVSNVICDSNQVAVFAGSFAYYNSGNTPPAQGNIVKNGTGTATTSGLWQDGISALQQLTYSNSMTMDASVTSDYFVTLLDGATHTFNAPLVPHYGQHLTLTVRNTFGAAGTAIFNAVFKMSAWTQPANGFSRSITWRWNNTNWVQIAQTGVDVAN